ncbi:MAG TPA: hypothetical protein VGD30_06385 [Telluria sp.]
MLAVRNEQMLAEVAGQCIALGAQALVVPTDVTMQDPCFGLGRPCRRLRVVRAAALRLKPG